MPTHRQLELFVAIADAGSMRRASDLLGISQPSISKQIKSLERSVGGPLFQRIRGERATLSALGEDLLEDARNSLAIQRRLLRRSSPSAERELRIFVRTYMLERIKTKLGTLAEAGLPANVNFMVSDEPGEALARDHEAGDVLAIFNAVRVPSRPDTICHVLSERYCAIYAAPEIARALGAGVKSARDVPVLLPGRNRLTPWLLGQMQAMSFEPGEQRFCSQFIDLIIERACQGEGFGAFMEDNVEALVQSGKLVRIARFPDPLFMVLLARHDVVPTVFERVRRAIRVLELQMESLSP